MDDQSAGRRGVLFGAAFAATLGDTLAQSALAPGASAQPARTAPAPPSAGQASPGQLGPADPAAANAGTVGVISGGVDGTYVRIAADLATVLDDGSTLRVLPIIGKGSVQNLSDIMHLRGIDIGIVQSDAFAFVRRQSLLPGAAQSIRYITKLYDEEVHVLARHDIARVADLAGQPVNIDVPGSGTAMTASLLFESLKVPVQPVNLPQDAALERLTRGEIAALVYVTGKPARLFAASSALAPAGLHFLPLQDEALLANYLPAQLGHAEYPGLVPDGAPVDTVAVGAVMAVFNWQPGSERHRKVERFIAALNAKFPELLKPPRHPKWREVNLLAQAPGWTRFASAQEVLAPAPASNPGTTPSPGPASARTAAAPARPRYARRWRRWEAPASLDEP